MDAVSVLADALSWFDGPDPQLTRADKRQNRKRYRAARRWQGRWCKCGPCARREAGNRYQYVIAGRTCACGRCPLWAPYPTCATKAWVDGLP